MARHERIHVWQKLSEVRIMPIFYHREVVISKEIVAACARAGLPVIEFTNRGDFADEVFAELERFAANNYPEIILGVGTVLDPYTAAIFLQKGANFLVSPHFDADIARLANRQRVPYFPGCASVDEIQRAEEAGCEIIKIFPGREVGGPDFIKAVRAPLPKTKLMPTGGVKATEESLGAWFNAGAYCVGMGSQLISQELLTTGNWSQLEQNLIRAQKIAQKS